jgi:hypothetical protein
MIARYRGRDEGNEEIQPMSARNRFDGTRQASIL